MNASRLWIRGASRRLASAWIACRRGCCRSILATAEASESLLARKPCPNGILLAARRREADGKAPGHVHYLIAKGERRWVVGNFWRRCAIEHGAVIRRGDACGKAFVSAAARIINAVAAGSWSGRLERGIISGRRVVALVEVSELYEVSDDDAFFPFRPCRAQRRQHYRRQKPDDGDDDEQFDERKTSGTRRAAESRVAADLSGLDPRVENN